MILKIIKRQPDKLFMIQSHLSIKYGNMFQMNLRILYSVRLKNLFEYYSIGLLEKDRFRRISLEDVLAHPWICKRSKDI